MNGKGSKRRPSFVSDQEMTRRWNLIFRKSTDEKRKEELQQEPQPKKGKSKKQDYPR